MQADYETKMQDLLRANKQLVEVNEALKKTNAQLAQKMIDLVVAKATLESEDEVHSAQGGVAVEGSPTVQDP